MEEIMKFLLNTSEEEKDLFKKLNILVYGDNDNALFLDIISASNPENRVTLSRNITQIQFEVRELINSSDNKLLINIDLVLDKIKKFNNRIGGEKVVLTDLKSEINTLRKLVYEYQNINTQINIKINVFKNILTKNYFTIVCMIFLITSIYHIITRIFTLTKSPILFSFLIIIMTTYFIFRKQ